MAEVGGPQHAVPPAAAVAPAAAVSSRPPAPSRPSRPSPPAVAAPAFPPIVPGAGSTEELAFVDNNVSLAWVTRGAANSDRNDANGILEGLWLQMALRRAFKC